MWFLGSISMIAYTGPISSKARMVQFLPLQIYFSYFFGDLGLMNFNLVIL